MLRFDKEQRGVAGHRQAEQHHAETLQHHAGTLLPAPAPQLCWPHPSSWDGCLAELRLLRRAAALTRRQRWPPGEPLPVPHLPYTAALPPVYFKVGVFIPYSSQTSTCFTEAANGTTPNTYSQGIDWLSLAPADKVVWAVTAPIQQATFSSCLSEASSLGRQEAPRLTSISSGCWEKVTSSEQEDLRNTCFLSGNENPPEAAEKWQHSSNMMSEREMGQSHGGYSPQPQPSPLRPPRFLMPHLDILQCMKAYVLCKCWLYSLKGSYFRFKESINALFITSAVTLCCLNHCSDFCSTHPLF